MPSRSTTAKLNASTVTKPAAGNHFTAGFLASFIGAALFFGTVLRVADADSYEHTNYTWVMVLLAVGASLLLIGATMLRRAEKSITAQPPPLPRRHDPRYRRQPPRPYEPQRLR